MIRVEKQQAVEEIKEICNLSNSVIVTHYHGLAVNDISTLRANLKEKNVSFKVVKNTLAKIAVEGTAYEGLAQYLSGPVALVYSQDAVASAKGVCEYAKKNNNLIVVGGVVDNQLYDPSNIEELSKLPSVEELRSKIIGLLQAPAQKLAQLMQEPASQLARTIKAYSTKE